jgi:lipopolysaccharide biosynthesis glycosyltransferase
LVLAALFPEQSKKERISICNPAIVHYTGAEKPWIPGSYHPWAWLYWESLDHTPFGNEVAREYGMTFGRRLRLLARWIRRHPKRLAGWNARIKRQAAPLPGADDDLDVSLAA